MKAKLSTIQNKADAAMSIYIRMKYADEHGYAKCCSCGRIFRWQDMDCGHFIPKSRGASIRWVEENCHPECRGCNRFDHGHLIGYTEYMIDMYGRDKIAELKKLAKETLSASQKRQLAEEAYEYYTNAIRNL